MKFFARERFRRLTVRSATAFAAARQKPPIRVNPWLKNYETKPNQIHRSAAGRFAGHSGRANKFVAPAADCRRAVHAGHVRFTEQVSAWRSLRHRGHDENIRLLKDEGHPLIGEAERRYVVGSIKFVKQALVSTVHGWLGAEPEIKKIKPDAYAVNEDGEKGGKREYCEKNGLNISSSNTRPHRDCQNAAAQI